MAKAQIATHHALSERVTPRQIEDDREYTPRQYHEDYGGPPESTQAKQRLTGDGCPYIKRGRRVTLLGRDIKEHRAKLRRVSTSDPGPAGTKAIEEDIAPNRLAIVSPTADQAIAGPRRKPRGRRASDPSNRKTT